METLMFEFRFGGRNFTKHGIHPDLVASRLRATKAECSSTRLMHQMCCARFATVGAIEFGGGDANMS